MNSLMNNNCLPLIKSETEICPDCKNKCILKGDEYNIRSICDFGHESNYNASEFEKAQYRHLKELKCNNCHSYINENNIFYCLTCELDLCAHCGNHHYNVDEIESKVHKIVKYNEKEYYCSEHKNEFNHYCFDCEKNLCSQCRKRHENHNIEYFKEYYEIISSKLSKAYKLFEKFNTFSQEILSKFNEIKNTFNIFYEKNASLGKLTNWQTLSNRKAYNLNYFIKDLENIFNKTGNENDYLKIFSSIMELYNKIYYTNSSTIIYRVNKNIIDQNIAKKRKEMDVKILGEIFVQNNKNKLEIEYENKIMKLNENIKIKLDKLKDYKFSIQLRGFNNKITDLSHFLDRSPYFIAIPDINKIYTKDLTNISYMFNGCTSLLCAPDISKLDLTNVTHINNIFSNCTSLQKCINPNLLNLNMDKLIDAKDMYYNCPLLKIKKNDFYFFPNDKRFEIFKNDFDDNFSDEYEKIHDNSLEENFRNYLEYKKEPEKSSLNLNSSFSIINKNFKSIDSKKFVVKEISNIKVFTKTEKEFESNNGNSSENIILMCNSIKQPEVRVIKLIEVKSSNENSSLSKNKQKKIRIKKTKKINKRNGIIKKVSFNIINFSFFINAIKYILNTYPIHSEWIKKKILCLKSTTIKVKCGLSVFNSEFLYLINYLCYRNFSSVRGEIIVYVTFLFNSVMVSLRGKGGTMISFKYPYGYFIANILHLSVFTFFNNLISFK